MAILVFFKSSEGDQMFKNMKISARLTLAVVASVLIVLFMSVLSYSRMGLMNRNTNKIVDDLYPKTEIARKIINNVDQIPVVLR